MAEGAKERQRPADVDILLNPDRAETQVPRWTVSIPYLFAGVLLPVACFILNWGIIPKPDWQTGKLPDYAQLFLAGPATACFYPLLAYSSGCIFLLTYWFERFSRHFVVRLGVYAGVLLAVQYSLAMAAMLVGATPLGAVTIAVPLVVRVFLGRWNRHESWGGRSSMIALYVLAALMLVLPAAAGLKRGSWFLPMFWCLGSAPLWAFLAFVLMSIRLLRQSSSVVARWKIAAGIAPWLAAYGVSLRLSVARATEIYASLPAEAPGDCYVCTAAARGHPSVVGSQPIRTEDGRVMLVNDQLRTLKLAEIALRERAPRLHRAIRGVYDVIGPPAARMLVHPLLADLAHLSLKPAEWLARLALAGFRWDLGGPTPPAVSGRAGSAPRAPRPAALAGAGGARTPQDRGERSRP